MHLVCDGGAGRVKASDVHADQVEGPARGAIAAGPAAPHILMRVDEALDLIFRSLFDDGAEIGEIILVVLARSGMFDGFPGSKQAQEGETPRAQAAEML